MISKPRCPRCQASPPPSHISATRVAILGWPPCALGTARSMSVTTTEISKTDMAPATVDAELPFAPMTLDEIDAIVMKGTSIANELNAPRSSEYVLNNRGQKLHVHSHWPDKPRAFVLFIHGYGSHSNRPTHRYVETHFGKEGVAYLTMDFHSMGYSEGEPRCSVRNPEDLLDDILSVLLALTADSAVGDRYHLKCTGKGLPFFLFGHSMGGGAALAASNIFWNGRKAVGMTPFAWSVVDALEARIVPIFRGAILMAPLTIFHHLPEWAKPWLRTVAMTFPEVELPTWFRKDRENMRNNWASERYIDYVLSDTKPEHNGLTFWGGVRLGTGLAMNDLCELVQESIPQAGFPMIFVHDPADATCSIEGSRAFVQQAPSMHKRLVELPGSLHDPMANMIDVVCHYTGNWVSTHLNLEQVKRDDPVTLHTTFPAETR